MKTAVCVPDMLPDSVTKEYKTDTTFPISRSEVVDHIIYKGKRLCHVTRKHVFGGLRRGKTAQLERLAKFLKCYHVGSEHGINSFSHDEARITREEQFNLYVANIK